MLVQQASSYDIGRHNFHIKERPMQENFAILCAGAAESAELTP
jgi:hypothetical protein